MRYRTPYIVHEDIPVVHQLPRRIDFSSDIRPAFCQRVDKNLELTLSPKVVFYSFQKSVRKLRFRSTVPEKDLHITHKTAVFKHVEYTDPLSIDIFANHIPYRFFQIIHRSFFIGF